MYSEIILFLFKLSLFANIGFLITIIALSIVIYLILSD